ncbi:MAG: type II toxin-antitoxin system HicA family toxin [Nodosilinea sp. WJT8-NPBG4]|jgi:predicted RNA binding protein YcfA (HicA-like mRNA interferase family)|nr:type II toxin-antitoxin system HicA family toxin [Nodosilinea sp. WJT8-NPBG4]
MSQWSSTKAKKVLAALEKVGWRVKRQTGSHKILEREGWNDYVFAFRDSDEIGSKMLARIAKKTGLTTQDL